MIDETAPSMPVGIVNAVHGGASYGKGVGVSYLKIEARSRQNLYDVERNEWFSIIILGEQLVFSFPLP